MSDTHELTRNQNLVLGALTQATGPLSAYGILDQVRSDGIKAPLQIYRALDKLVEKGLAHRLESLNASLPAPMRMSTTPGLPPSLSARAAAGLMSLPMRWWKSGSRPGAKAPGSRPSARPSRSVGTARTARWRGSSLARPRRLHAGQRFSTRVPSRSITKRPYQIRYYSIISP